MPGKLSQTKLAALQKRTPEAKKQKKEKEKKENERVAKFAKEWIAERQKGPPPKSFTKSAPN